MSCLQTDYRDKVTISWVDIYCEIANLPLEKAISLFDALLAYFYPTHVKEEP